MALENTNTKKEIEESAETIRSLSSLISTREILQLLQNQNLEAKVG